jgi:hypothetical protein
MHQEPEYIQSSNQALSNTAYALSVVGSLAQDENNKRDCMEALGWEIDSGGSPSPFAPAPIAAQDTATAPAPAVFAAPAAAIPVAPGAMSAMPIASTAPTAAPPGPPTPGPAIGLPDHLPGEPTGYQTTTVHPN